MTDYRAKLADLATASTQASWMRESRALLAKYGPWLRRYHGGLPVGIFATIMKAESGGKMSAPGDVSLGEVGFYQITKSLPGEVKLPADARYDPETNVFLGGIEYQLHAAKVAKLYGVTGPDQWRLSRLIFSIGDHGTQDLVARARAAVSSGSIWDRVVTFVDQQGGVAYGSQTAEKVWFRVHFVDFVFGIGQKVSYGGFGPPTVLPAPPAYPKYTFPPALLPFARKGLGAGPVAIFAGAALAVVALRALRH